MIHIGISGWNYAGWRGDFYPDRLPQRRELEWASRRFTSIEVNGTFYSLQRPESFEQWRRTAPDGFVYAIKGSRFITHMKQLREPEQALANFLAQGVLRLDDKLGPMLWQFPDRMRLDDERAERLDRFLAMLPRDTHQAAALAERHGPQVAGRAWLEPGPKRRLRHAVEVRHPSCFDDHLVRILRRHGVAFVFSDAADWPYAEEITAGFVYIRLHGSRRTYTSRYSDGQLDTLARKIGDWATGAEPEDAVRITGRPPPRRKSRDVYVYFDNDAKVHAPRDARRLARRLGVAPPQTFRWKEPEGD